nr:type II secretion system GspH family protein [Lachnospiraceae bacterium]
MSGKTQPRWQLDNAGLTLVEILVSMAIFAIMLFPMLTGFNSLLKQNKTAKLTQAETDYAARVMEEFKQNSDVITASGSGATQLGYNYSESGDTLVYTKNNITIGQDFETTPSDLFNLSSNAVRKLDTNGNEYRVVVSLDASAYETSNSTAGGDIYDYKDPNASLDYNLDNIDERFSVLIRDTGLNYDTRATTDLVDKAAKVLKETDSKRYNMWLNGVVNVFMNAKYAKNTYIKVDRN